MSLRAGIVGAAGYAGGELLRLLLAHPEVREVVAASSSLAGKPVTTAHPNLRKRTDLAFVPYEDVRGCDVLFLALPNGSQRYEEFRDRAPLVIDLSSDHRLRDPKAYEVWYGAPHPHPERLAEAVYGIPELHRERIAGARLVTGAGCNATAAILALLPLARASLIDRERPVVIECKVGSSEGGREASEDSHHPERSGVVRSFRPVGHRHTAEIEQELGCRVQLSVTSVELVRGVLATAHVPVRSVADEKVLWRAYREAYAKEPFVRIVKERTGIYRYPEPKLLAGTNFADVGFALDARGDRVVALCAIDNLVKGAAGNGVQAMNVALGLPEDAGLGFVGLHP
ncbi:MAG: N-acetyl-gamma-glutamyl-phosphate reductase [Chloroflexota bacterium]|nr:N-acetyl-gamma-glutamyl-phosphate reductase [Chloroflexota bacterium]MDE3194167.1 N-acetyl-gamma-glutamyl-phosphate reductase [Chloroflexota bacterium]